MATVENPQADRQSPKSAGPVERAFLLLQAIVAAETPVGVRELGRRTGLPRSTVSRLTTILVEVGMASRLSDGSLGPGTALTTLAPATNDPDTILRDRLRPLLTELAATFNEHAALSIDAGDTLVYIGYADAEQTVSVASIEGHHHRFHLVAPGLMTMAHWPTDRLDAYLAKPLDAPTPHSQTEPAAIRYRLARARGDGFVWTDQELDEGINGLAVPITADDRLVATVSLYGPSYRFSAEARPTLADDLVDLVDRRAGVLVT